MSGATLRDGTEFRKGEPGGDPAPPSARPPAGALQAIIERIARSGGTPLAVSRGPDRDRGRPSP